MFPLELELKLSYNNMYFRRNIIISSFMISPRNSFQTISFHLRAISNVPF